MRTGPFSFGRRALLLVQVGGCERSLKTLEHDVWSIIPMGLLVRTMPTGASASGAAMWWVLQSAARKVTTWPGGAMSRAFSKKADHPSRREFGLMSRLDELRLSAGTSFIERQLEPNDTLLFVTRGSVEVAHHGETSVRVTAGAFVAVTSVAGESLHLEVADGPDARLFRVVLPGAVEASQAPRPFAPIGRDNRLETIASWAGARGGLSLTNDVLIRWGRLQVGSAVRVRTRRGRMAWLQVISGAVRADQTSLSEGDGAAIEGAGDVLVYTNEAAELIVIELEDPGERLLWNGDG